MPAESSEITALLFDFGGTLAFLDYAMLAEEFSRDGLKLDALTLERSEYEGRRALDHALMSERSLDVDGAYRRFFRTWLETAGVPPGEVATLGRRFSELHAQTTLWRVVSDATAEVLERLKSTGLKLAIVSNADGRVEADARRFGIADYFDTIVDSQVVGVAKPDPRIFRIALERLDVNPHQARYTGDIYSIDILGARAAGIESRLIDPMDCYSWVEHEKIRSISGLYPLD